VLAPSYERRSVDPRQGSARSSDAADSIIDHIQKAIEVEDIEVRVAALEQVTSQSKNK
jgi:hypothetical protein